MFRLAARSFSARNLNVAARPVVASRLALAARSRIVPRAAFSAAAGLSKEDITTRVLDVLKSFEKVDGAKVSSDTSNCIFVCRADCDVSGVAHYYCGLRRGPRPGQPGRRRGCYGRRGGT